MRINELGHGVAGLQQLIIAVNLLIGRTGGVLGDYMPIEAKTVAQLQAIMPVGPAVSVCSDEVGGPTLVFFEPNAGEWQRSYDRVAIST